MDVQLAYLNPEMESSNSTMDQHVVTTVKRLQTVKELIGEQHSFQAATRELLEWCSDSRAFSPSFEPYLMDCLSVLRQCAQNEGYDLDLSYRLIAICASNADRFCQRSADSETAVSTRSTRRQRYLASQLPRASTPTSRLVDAPPVPPQSPISLPTTSAQSAMQAEEGPSASTPFTGLLRRWREELGKSLLHRHNTSSHIHTPEVGKESSTTEQLGGYSTSATMQQPGLQQQQAMLQQQGLRPQTTIRRREGAPGWPADPGPPIQAGRSNTGGVAPGYGGYATNTQTPPSMYHVPVGMQPRSAATDAGYPLQQTPMYYRNPRPSLAGPSMIYRSPYPNQPVNGNPEYQPPPGALSAAAMVTAAANATSTTAGGMVHDQQPPYHRQPSGGANPTPMSSTYAMGYGAPAGMQAGMRGPSPSATMMVNREMANAAPGGPMPTQHAMSVHRRHAPYSNHTMLQQQQQRRAHYPPSAGVHSYGPMVPQMPPYGQPVHGGQYPAHIRQPNGVLVHPNQQTYSNGAPPPYASQVMSRSNSTTPQPNMPMQQYQNGYAMPQNIPEGRPTPVHLPTSPYMHLTFPIREGIILQPFTLEHNLSVSHHEFNLPNHLYQMLQDKPDYELQLKSFNNVDPTQTSNWPGQLNVCVNNRPFLIDRGDSNANHRPLYLKHVCLPGKNTLTISVVTCCCSHSFVMQLVHRPSVRSILQNLARKRLLPIEACILKIKAYFGNYNTSGMPTDDGVEQTSVKVSLKCPVTFRRIKLPARGIECRHTQCFDLEPYLQMNAERGVWRCPICKSNAMISGIEIDQYMMGIIEQLSSTEIEEIIIDANAVWKPSMPKLVPKEEDNKDLGAMNRWKVYNSNILPNNLPAVGTYEAHHNPTSPYPTPPNSHNSQGSNSIAHFNGGMYDAGFNSPPDFTGPMSNRSDASENDKRLAMLTRQAGISSPSQGPTCNSQTTSIYSVPAGGPASNGPTKMSAGPASNMVPTGQPSNMIPSGPPSNMAPGGPPSNMIPSGPPSNMAPGGPPSNMAPGGPPSNAPLSQGPPSNAPASQGPPSNAPGSHGGPASNAPGSHGGPASNAPATNSSPLGAAATSELPAEITDLVNNGSSANDSLPLEDLFDSDMLAYLGPEMLENSAPALGDDILSLLEDS